MSEGMSNKEARLAAFFAAEEPPAHDPVFTRTVVARMERRPVLEMVLDQAPLAIALVAITWALWPAFTHSAQGVAEFMGVALPIGVAAMIAGGTMWVAMRLRLVPSARALGW
jgi:hypothetical protein